MRNSPRVEAATERVFTKLKALSSEELNKRLSERTDSPIGDLLSMLSEQDNGRDKGVSRIKETLVPEEEIDCLVLRNPDVVRLEEEIARLNKANTELRAEVECEERRFAVLQDHLAEIAKERDELRAQLAHVYKTLKPYFTSGNSIDVERAMIPKTVYESLPATAKHDANILRCAEKQEKQRCGGTYCPEFRIACVATCNAVRAREEASK